MRTIRDLVENSTAKYADQVAFQIKRGGEYQKFTFFQAGERITGLALALQGLGVARGDRVAILSENRPEWGISFLAITYMGAVAVPLDALLTGDNISNLLFDSGAKVIIASEKFFGLLEEIKSKLPDLKEIISMEKPLPAGVGTITSETDQDDLASLVYTSGTTGCSKGVMLTHQNIVFDVLSTVGLFKLGPGDNFLSVLPLQHTFETTAGFLGPYSQGCTITYAESLKSYQLVANMQETGVTVMCGVPLLYQLFYNSILSKIEEKGLPTKIFFTILGAISYFFSRIIGFNIGKILFKPVAKTLGGKIRFFVSGGAAIDPMVIKGFELLGIPILQGYGLTESAPIITCCDLEHNKVGSVGRAIPGVEIKVNNPDIAGVGEIFARGPNIMKGYYKRKDLTREVISNGWLYTGDLGYIDSDGYLFITGRAKDIIVTGSGVNVYPEELEFGLNRLQVVKESCVVGVKSKTGLKRGMEEVWVIVVPDYEYLEKYAAENGVNLSAELTRSLINEQVQRFNETQADYKRIVNTLISEVDLPKTSTRKVRRFVVKREFGLV